MIIAIHLGNRRALPIVTKTAYVKHIKKFIIIAENPKMITRSLKKGSGNTISLAAGVGAGDPCKLKMIKIKKAKLQISVNFDKKEIIFM